MSTHIHNILKCPVSGESLRLMHTEDLDRLNSTIHQGNLYHLDNSLVRETIEAGCISHDFALKMLRQSLNRRRQQGNDAAAELPRLSDYMSDSMPHHDRNFQGKGKGVERNTLARCPYEAAHSRFQYGNTEADYANG